MMWTLLTVVALFSAALAGDAEDAQALADANSEFALDFYSEIAKMDDIENIFFSPFSISTALAMASRGAAGDTKSEMYTAMGYSAMQENDVLDKQMKLLKVLNNDMNKYNLSVANKLFPEETFTLNSDFRKAMQDYFNSDIEKVDFANKPEEARGTINDWVEDETKDKIQDLLPEGSVDGNTVLYLVNAIYFGAKWLNPFDDKANIADQDFHLSDTETTKVTYMSRAGKSYNYPYAELEDLDAKLVELPYTDADKVAMYVLLPNQVQGLSKVEGSLKPAHFSNANAENIFSKLNGNVKVNIQLPKFEMTQTINPKSLLQELGMEKAFIRSAADFSRITDATTQQLFISSIVHKAFINVHEGGTEAAAATGIGISLTSFDPSTPMEFYANHPFLYFIREKTTGSILFMGRYVMPPQEGGELKVIGELKAMPALGEDGDNHKDPTGSAITYLSSVLSLILGLFTTMLFH